VVVPAHSFPVHGSSFCHPFFFPTCSPFFFSNWCWGFGFGVSVGFGFGYPYCGYPYYGYPYYGYPYYGSYGYYPYSYYPYSRVCVGYPYAGYYYSYPYSYLDDCGYGCDFYDGYNVRFGYYRSSYYATCSGYGAHDWRHHHCHSCPCDVHGYHYYHVRDCPLCYPDGGSYVEHDVNVPEAVAGGAAGPQPEAPVQGAATPESSPEARTIAPEREESFFASLRPAQLSFAMGLIHFREGDYDQAAEDFYNSSVEDPSSRLVKVFLGVSLFAVGEYSFAAEYFRLGLDEWPAFTRHPWNVQRMYGNSADFTHQLATLHDAESMDSRGRRRGPGPHRAQSERRDCRLGGRRWGLHRQGPVAVRQSGGSLDCAGLPAARGGGRPSRRGGARRSRPCRREFPGDARAAGRRSASDPVSFVPAKRGVPLLRDSW
jgi:hypothetical protein